MGDFDYRADHTDTDPGSGMANQEKQPAAKRKSSPWTTAFSRRRTADGEFLRGQIDLTNTNQILQYGAGTQKKMADFSEAAWKM